MIANKLVQKQDIRVLYSLFLTEVYRQLNLTDVLQKVTGSQNGGIHVDELSGFLFVKHVKKTEKLKKLLSDTFEARWLTTQERALIYFLFWPLNTSSHFPRNVSKDFTTYRDFLVEMQSFLSDDLVIDLVEQMYHDNLFWRSCLSEPEDYQLVRQSLLEKYEFDENWDNFNSSLYQEGNNNLEYFVWIAFLWHTVLLAKNASRVCLLYGAGSFEVCYKPVSNSRFPFERKMTLAISDMEPVWYDFAYSEDRSFVKSAEK